MKANSLKSFKACQSYSSSSDFDEDECQTCPECGSEDVESDDYSMSCNDCDYGSEVDYDDILEERAEAKAEARMERYESNLW